jgi:hypothetical protein
MPNQSVVLEDLKANFRSSIPSGAAIIKGAMQVVLGSHINDPVWIKKNFSSLVEDIQLKAYEMYLKAEAPAAAAAIQEVLGPLLPHKPTKDQFFKMLSDHFWVLDKFFLGLTQGRRPRAGKAFEHVIRVLFGTLGYPYDSQPIINGQPDFLLPSVEHYRKYPVDCIIFTVKRSLRERWRQITTEGAHGFRLFLATIDGEVGSRDLLDIKKNRIVLVVPQKVKDECYADSEGVITFERFFRHELDPAMARWEEDGVI